MIRTSESGYYWHNPHDVAVEDLFDILDLLAKLLDHGLERQPDARQLDIGGFRAQRVGLAVQLLAKEIEPPADGFSLLQKIPRLLEVGTQPPQLLPDIGARDEHCHLLCYPLLGQA